MNTPAPRVARPRQRETRLFLTDVYLRQLLEPTVQLSKRNEDEAWDLIVRAARLMGYSDIEFRPTEEGESIRFYKEG